MAQDAGHAIEPLHYDGDWLIAKQTLVEIINETPRTEIVENDSEYLHVTYKSKTFGFVDDMEFIFHDAQKIIHVRSASRVGYYDFGVNRKRVERLRRLLKR